LLEQAFDSVGSLGANALPVSHAVQRNAQTFFSATGGRVVETHALDAGTVAANALIGNNNVEKRTSLRAAAGESNDDHDLSFGWLQRNLLQYFHDV
jgi:ABC-type hemin transport system ATPase subunit